MRDCGEVLLVDRPMMIDAGDLCCEVWQELCVLHDLDEGHVQSDYKVNEVVTRSINPNHHPHR